jgi:hypothetical protein
MNPEILRLRPAQESRVVYGLRGFDQDLRSIDRDPALASMDAPGFFPAGSMQGFGITSRRQVIMERCIPRAKDHQEESHV